MASKPRFAMELLDLEEERAICERSFFPSSRVNGRVFRVRPDLVVARTQLRTCASGWILPA